MRFLFTLLMFALTCICAKAQIKEGTITYERKINLHKMIKNEEMKAMMPEFRTSKHQLLFNDTASLYKAVVEEESIDPFEGGGGGGMRMMRFGGGGANDEVYKNYNSYTSTKQTELADKNFLIEDTIRKQGWKLSSETKTILSHPCHKATAKQRSLVGGMRSMSFIVEGNKQDSTKKITPPDVEVVAWFADDIKTPAGPDTNGGLPGLILELNINDGETVYTALDIKDEPVKKTLKVPTKGKKVTKEEFAKLQKQMFENMQGGPGGGGMRVIRGN